MAAYQKFESFVEQQLIAPCDFNADTFKLALSNTAPNLTTADFFNDITEITAGNGYTAGGLTLAGVTVSRSGGTAKITADDAVLTATGGIGPFRYVIFYKSTGTAATSPLISMWDYGSSISLLNGETFTADINPTNGLVQLS